MAYTCERVWPNGHQMVSHYATAAVVVAVGDTIFECDTSAETEIYLGNIGWKHS